MIVENVQHILTGVPKLTIVLSLRVLFGSGSECVCKTKELPRTLDDLTVWVCWPASDELQVAINDCHLDPNRNLVHALSLISVSGTYALPHVADVELHRTNLRGFSGVVHMVELEEIHGACIRCP